jgi:ferredoxin
LGLKKFLKSDLDTALDQLISSGTRIEAPVAKRERFVFGTLEKSSYLRLDYDVTLLPPKKYFFPPRKQLYTFSDTTGYQSQVDSEPFILFGVHPYDMIALNQLDILFSEDPCDTHYIPKRRNCTIVALDVITPSENVFAAAMGMAVVDSGYDMLITAIGPDEFIADAPTQKGQALLDCIIGCDPTDEDLAKRLLAWEENHHKLKRHYLKCKPSDIPSLLERGYNHPIWEEKARTCFSCGSCNNVCPTCYCFDFRDEVDWHFNTSCRIRYWDECLLKDFTRVAGGHIFRKTATQRFRHRLYRKGMYVPAKVGGQMSCVGCGRCVGSCLPDIANPVNVYNRLVDDLGVPSS